jgi:hypothetical protein
MAISNWLRAGRVASYWVGSFLTLMLLLVIAFGIMHLLSLDTCGAIGSKDLPPACTPVMSMALSAALIGGILLVYLPSVAFLRRKLALEKLPQHEGVNSAFAPPVGPSEARRLGLGQELLRGRVGVESSSGRTLRINGLALTLWSLYPFQKGWIRPGIDLAIVYQHVPFSRIKLLLAFCDEHARVRGVAAFTQGVSLVIAGICVIFFSKAAVPFGSLLLAVSGFVAGLDVVYLSLMLRAKTNLRGAVECKNP